MQAKGNIAWFIISFSVFNLYVIKYQTDKQAIFKRELRSSDNSLYLQRSWTNPFSHHNVHMKVWDYSCSLSQFANFNNFFQCVRWSVFIIYITLFKIITSNYIFICTLTFSFMFLDFSALQSFHFFYSS